MTDNPLFSLIIPVYNVEAYLSKCLDSIVKQQFKDYEAILIDDGSTDNSPIICDEYAERYPQLSVIHKENGGVSSARNVGLDTARGEWIWFVDSDDYIVEEALQKLAETIKKYECDTIFFGLLHDNNSIITQDNNQRVDIFNETKTQFLEHVFCFTNPSMLFFRSILQTQSIRFTEGIRMAEDLELQYKYLLFCEQPIQIKNHLYVYQHREGSATTNAQTEINNVNDCLTVANNLANYVNKYSQKELLWFSLRIRTLLKGCLQSAELLSRQETCSIQKRLREICKKFNDIGFCHIEDNTIRLALINISLYYFLLRVYYKIKGIKR